jgi:hypothetical protein
MPAKHFSALDCSILPASRMKSVRLKTQVTRTAMEKRRKSLKTPQGLFLYANMTDQSIGYDVESE